MKIIILTFMLSWSSVTLVSVFMQEDLTSIHVHVVNVACAVFGTSLSYLFSKGL
jgi:hypothetical protein